MHKSTIEMSSHLLLAIIFFAVILSSVSSQFRFACAPNFCQVKVGPCPELNCDNGRIINNATECECCHICVHPLEKGQVCNTGELSVLPRLECGPGLVCFNDICSPASTKCNKDQRSYDEDFSNEDMITGKPRPDCDDYGFYNPVTCKPGMLCYCVDKEGERIFGTALHTENKTMNCNCSRDYHEFSGKMNHPYQFMQCLENGNYDPMQCADDICFCVDSHGEIDGSVIPANGSLETLRCYNEKKRPREPVSKCWNEFISVSAQVESYENKGVKVIGVDLPNCSLDGSYAPVQCKNDKCFCVKKDGTVYEEGYSAVRNSADAIAMTCRCVREKELVRQNQEVLQHFSSYKCSKNGNYLPLQCVYSMCFCVDKMGFQNTEAVLMNDRQSLKCYKNEYEDYLQ